MNKDYPNEDVEHVVDGVRIHISTYDSFGQFGAAALRRETRDNGQFWTSDMGASRWAGGKPLKDLAAMSQGDGWREMLDETLTIAEEAVEIAEREHEMQSFEPTFDVSGEDVDVSRYLTGEPECMIDYPLTVTSKVGRVVTLVSAGCVSSAVDPEDYIRRGQVLAALAIALERLGHACELWLDIGYSYDGKQYHSRILVKGTADTIDPAMIMMAYAHPGTLRRLGFADCDGDKFSRDWPGRGHPADACRIDMPENAIYTPSLTTGYARKDTHTELRKYLSLLGLIPQQTEERQN